MPLRALNLPAEFIYVFAVFSAFLPLLKFRRLNLSAAFCFELNFGFAGRRDVGTHFIFCRLLKLRSDMQSKFNKSLRLVDTACEAEI